MKKCIECNEDAQHKIKDTSEYYCKECALEHFGDVEMLITLEEEAQALKGVLDNLSPQELEDNGN